MVGCDMCDQWYHATCVGIAADNLDPNGTWRCEGCVQDVALETSSNTTKKTTRSSGSRKSQITELTLKMIEEEQALLQKNREKEDELRRREEEVQRKRAEEDAALLRKKQQALLAMEEGGSIHSGLSNRSSRKKVQQWLIDGEHSEIPVKVTTTVVTSTATVTSGIQTSDSGTLIKMPPNSTSTPTTACNTTVLSSIAPAPPISIPIYTNSMWGGYNPWANAYQYGSFGMPSQSSLYDRGLINPYGTQPGVMSGFQHLPFIPYNPISTSVTSTFGGAPRVTAATTVSPAVSAPVVTIPAPVVTVPAPVVTVPAPVVTVPAPVVTVPAPVVTVPAPVVTIPAPVVTVPAPVVTVPAPVVTAPAPVVTAASIPAVSSAPVVAGHNAPPPQQTDVASTSVLQSSGNHFAPSGTQIAARQVIQRDLPIFSGDAQDWPLFASSFYNTTAACGYTDAENLARLQRCLRGHALDSVKSRLLLPQSVPHVMEMLRMLYGRPEILLQSLLQKLRSAPSPKADNLQSIITYGMAVRNLVDHIQVAGLVEHLRNPMLVHELVEKLPPQMRMQWSWFKRAVPDVNLATFGDFMLELVRTASDVAIPAEVSTQRTKTSNEKQKLYVHTESYEDEPTTTNSSKKPNAESTEKTCAYCSARGHQVALCAQFRDLDIDARWKAIRMNGLCRTCLAPHRRWPCRTGKECGVEGCRFRHHALLHTPIVTEVSDSVSRQNHHAASSSSLFRYLPVTLKGNGKSVETFAFLDDGSETTLMEAELAADLNIRGPEEPLYLAWTGNISREEKGSQRISVAISGTGMKSQFKLNNVRTVQKLKLQSQTFDYTKLQEKYPHLRGLPLLSYIDAVPRMIIGIEHAQLLSSLRVREGKANEPVAAKTRVGWCVYGKQADKDRQAVERLHVHTEEIGNRELHELMKQYFGIEEAAISTPLESEEDSRARLILGKTTRRIEGGFETGLLWKYDNPCFPNSYPLAVRRMESLEKRLAKEQGLKERVNALIAEYETKGYAHRITQQELDSTAPNRAWYLPLGIVRNPKKPEKIRLIWDAAARVHGVSFNDMLLKGPDMLTSLFAVLLRFRQRSVAICGDIREMFHQIRIIAEDKQSQRFVYREHQDQTPQIFVMDVATFGATCSPCSAQHVKNINAKEFAELFPRAADAIVKAHYVDDFLDSADTVDEAVKLAEEVKLIHAKGGFDIRGFSSNSSEVLRRLGENQIIQEKSLNLDQIVEVERVLGMVWRPAVDIFTFDTTLKDDLVELLVNGTTPTKRQVLRLVMSLFDPYGFIAHFIIHGKILMQHIWRSGTGWDEKIAEGLHGLWNDWTNLLKRLGDVEVPRCFFGGASSRKFSSIQLHMFVDASELAYAAVAYLRIVQDGKVRVVLVGSKTKVAPLKPHSIPRLEVQGGVIGCRLLDAICGALDLPIERRFLWTDSRTVLAWIWSDSRRYHPFVGFRIAEILNLTSMDEWFFVPSKMNVADDATKWGLGPCFNKDCRWYLGPLFLYLSEDKWPEQPMKKWTTTEELRAVFQHHRENPPPLIDPARFSNWNRLLRATAYVLRSSKLFRKIRRSGPLTQSELLQAEKVLWRQTQFEAFPDEYCTLEFNKLSPEKQEKRIDKSSTLYQLSPFMDDDGVIRMNSRLAAASTVPFDAKFPIILPKDHKLTYLLIDNYHRRFKHQNRETVFNEIRQQFWIPKLRSVIQRVVKQCQHCKIRKAAPGEPMMAPLPKVRLTPYIRAFSYTGIDYFGPIQVKQGRSLVKRWVALFTCLTTRAVHLEIVHSLSTQSCVMAIRRFVARRGNPLDFYSDNGTCFRGASNLLMKQIQAIHEDCAVTFTSAKTNWHFNPPAAPHMGGCWERMVRSVKAAMGAVADHPRHPSDEVLETVVLEAESIVNSRPLTYIPLDHANQEALTPNHFLLYGSSGIVQPKSTLVNVGSTLRDSWNLAQYLADEFWKRWIKEYLPTLTRRTKWFNSVKPLEPGTLVMVIDVNKRNGWLRGRVIEVMRGKDDQVRSAVVSTADGLLTRPAVKLAVLDVSNNQEATSDSPELHGRGDVKETRSGHPVDGVEVGVEVGVDAGSPQ